MGISDTKKKEFKAKLSPGFLTECANLPKETKKPIKK